MCLTHSGTFSNIFVYEWYSQVSHYVTYFGARFFKHAHKTFQRVTLDIRTGKCEAIDEKGNVKVLRLKCVDDTKHVSFIPKRKSTGINIDGAISEKSSDTKY